MIAKTPKPPYYAVIFTSQLKVDSKDYMETAARMERLAKEQPGFLGIESARNEYGITVSYWKDEDSISHWKKHLDHKIAQERGKNEWYERFKTRVCKVERDYEFEV